MLKRVQLQLSSQTCAVLLGVALVLVLGLMMTPDEQGSTRPWLTGTREWTIASPEAVCYLDLAQSTLLGLQVYVEDSLSSATVEWSLDRKTWGILDEVGAGQWVARREHQGFLLRIPRPEHLTGRVLPIWVRVRGFEGEGLVVVRM